MADLRVVLMEAICALDMTWAHVMQVLKQVKIDLPRTKAVPVVIMTSSTA